MSREPPTSIGVQWDEENGNCTSGEVKFNFEMKTGYGTPVWTDVSTVPEKCQNFIVEK